jgi:transporter family-2 protein
MEKTLIFLVFISIIVGGLLPIQGAFNAHLGKNLNHPLQASVISFGVGFIFLSILSLIISKQLFPINSLNTIPWYYFTGGLIGAVFVTTVLLLVPKIGTANVLAGAIVGQLIVSAVMDHYGIFGVPKTTISIERVIGIALLIIGVYLVAKE